MPLDARKNFAKGQLSGGYDNAVTSIALSSGHGARFAAAPFNAVWWNATDYGDPSDDPNVEIVRVTAVSSDTFTIVRAQEGTSATVKNLSGKTYKLLAGVTKKSFDDLDSQLAPGVLALTFGSTLALDLTQFLGKNMGSVTLTGNCTLGAITGGYDTQPIKLRVVQNATGGFTLSPGSSVRLMSNISSLSVNTTPNSVSYISGVWNSVSNTLDVFGLSLQ